MTVSVVDGPRSLPDRVDALMNALSSAKTYHAARAALELADLATLRAVEAEFNFLPAATGVIREAIANAHMRRVNLRGRDVAHTGKVTDAAVAGWALAAMCQALPGYTDWEREFGGQYRLTITETPDDPKGAVVLEVSTVQRQDPRRYTIRVQVEELTDAFA